MKNSPLMWGRAHLNTNGIRAVIKGGREPLSLFL